MSAWLTANADMIRLVAQLASTAVALVALYVSFRTEHRNHVRFKQQLHLSERIAKANVRPLVALTLSGYLNKAGLELENHGAGTAVISDISFHLGTRTGSSVPRVLDLKHNVEWNDFTDYEDSTPTYLPAKSTETLVELTLENLLRQGFTKDQATVTLKRVESQLDEVCMKITYEDVLGNVIAKNELLD